jgi:hypothetical protein
MPNDPVHTALIKKFLETLAAMFPGVDTSTYNAARVCKLYGTMVRKGPETPDRPNRVANIRDIPAEIKIVSEEMIRNVAYPEVEGQTTQLPETEIKRTFDPAIGDIVKKGERHTRFKSRVASMLNRREPYDIILSACLTENQKFDPPMDEKEAIAEIKSLHDNLLPKELKSRERKDKEKENVEKTLENLTVDGVKWNSTDEEKKKTKKQEMCEKYQNEHTDKQRDCLTDEEIEQNNKAKLAKEHAAKSVMLPDFPGTTHPLFSRWMKLGSDLSYSRVPFHFFALLTVLSMALGRRVKTKLGLNSLFANIFCMLIGTSSVSGKSYASQMVNDNFVGTINTWSDKLTEPRLIQKLADNNTMYWHYDECQAFFKDVEKFNGSILSRMCLIYDGLKVQAGLSISRMDKNSQEWICKDPFMSCLFSMTTDQFNMIANSELITGGFLPRWMFIVEEGGTVEKNKDPTTEQEKEIAEIQGEIKYVYENLNKPGVDESGKIDTSKNVNISFYVCDKIEQWKIDNTNKNLGPDGINQRIAVQRAFGFAYKLAMIFSVYDKEFQKEIFGKTYPFRIQLPDRWVNEAINITEVYLLPRLVYILDKSAEENTKSTMSTIRRILKENNGSIERGKLIRKSRILTDEMDKAIRSMIESDEITEEKETSLGVGRPRKIYCLKN